jgi:hypothetical protein
MCVIVDNNTFNERSFVTKHQSTPNDHARPLKYGMNYTQVEYDRSDISDMAINIATIIKTLHS